MRSAQKHLIADILELNPWRLHCGIISNFHGIPGLLRLLREHTMFSGCVFTPWGNKFTVIRWRSDCVLPPRNYLIVEEAIMVEGTEPSLGKTKPSPRSLKIRNFSL